jgi:hypoxanthine phosphoribosyltransferase
MDFIEYIYILSAIIGIAVALPVIWGFLRRWRKRKLHPEMPPDVTLIESPPSWEEVYTGVKKLSERIASEYEPELLVAISSGGAIIGGMLSRLLDIPLTQIIRSNPRSEETKPDNSNTVFLPDAIMAGKKILLVDDVARSGQTLEKYYAEIQEGGESPSEIRSACLMISGEHWIKKPDYCVYGAHKIGIRMPWDYHRVSR